MFHAWDLQANESRKHTLLQRVQRLASQAAVKMTMSRDKMRGGGEAGLLYGKPSGMLLAPRSSKGIKVETDLTRNDGRP